MYTRLNGRTLWLDVYGTSFNCHDQMHATLTELARFAARPFAVTGVAEGEDFAWYFGPSRRDTAAFEIASKASAIADQLRELRRRMTRNTDPRLAPLQSAVRECTRLLQRAVKPLRDISGLLTRSPSANEKLHHRLSPERTHLRIRTDPCRNAIRRARASGSCSRRTVLLPQPTRRTKRNGTHHLRDCPSAAC
jgi:hypothetical protein